MLTVFRSSILFILILLFLSSCLPRHKRLPVNFSAPNIGVSSTKLDAELKSLTVTVARPDEAIGKIEVPVVFCDNDICPISFYVGMWKTALEESFNRMAIFKDDSPKKVSLAVKILKFQVSEFPATHTSVRYEIIDRSNGSIIFTTDISTSGEGRFDFDIFADNPVGSQSVDGINRSVQKNIIQFLQALETVDMEKPMFPSNKKID